MQVLHYNKQEILKQAPVKRMGFVMPRHRAKYWSCIVGSSDRCIQGKLKQMLIKPGIVRVPDQTVVLYEQSGENTSLSPAVPSSPSLPPSNSTAKPLSPAAPPSLPPSNSTTAKPLSKTALGEAALLGAGHSGGKFPMRNLTYGEQSSFDREKDAAQTLLQMHGADGEKMRDAAEDNNPLKRKQHTGLPASVPVQASKKARSQVNPEAANPKANPEANPKANPETNPKANPETNPSPQPSSSSTPSAHSSAQPSAQLSKDSPDMIQVYLAISLRKFKFPCKAIMVNSNEPLAHDLYYGFMSVTPTLSMGSSSSTFTFSAMGSSSSSTIGSSQAISQAGKPVQAQFSSGTQLQDGQSSINMSFPILPLPSSLVLPPQDQDPCTPAPTAPTVNTTGIPSVLRSGVSSVHSHSPSPFNLPSSTATSSSSITSSSSSSSLSSSFSPQNLIPLQRVPLHLQRVPPSPAQVRIFSMYASSPYTPSMGRQLVTVLGTAPVQTVVYGARNLPGMQEDMYAIQTSAFLEALCTTLENGDYAAIMPSIIVLAKNTASLGTKYEAQLCSSIINAEKLLEIMKGTETCKSQLNQGNDLGILTDLLAVFVMNVLAPMAARNGLREQSLKMWREARAKVDALIHPLLAQSASSTQQQQEPDARTVSIAAVGLLRRVDQICRMLNDFSVKNRVLKIENVNSLYGMSYLRALFFRRLTHGHSSAKCKQVYDFFQIKNIHTIDMSNNKCKDLLLELGPQDMCPDVHLMMKGLKSISKLSVAICIATWVVKLPFTRSTIYLPETFTPSINMLVKMSNLALILMNKHMLGASCKELGISGGLAAWVLDKGLQDCVYEWDPTFLARFFKGWRTHPSIQKDMTIGEPGFPVATIVNTKDFNGNTLEWRKRLCFTAPVPVSVPVPSASPSASPSAYTSLGASTASAASTSPSQQSPASPPSQSSSSPPCGGIQYVKTQMQQQQQLDMPQCDFIAQPLMVDYIICKLMKWPPSVSHRAQKIHNTILACGPHAFKVMDSHMAVLGIWYDRHWQLYQPFYEACGVETSQ